MMAVFAFLKKRFCHRYTAVCFRMILGTTFIWASFDKISHPKEFIKVVENYKLLPFALVVIFAVSLPWMELICGLLLIAGAYTRSSTTVLTFMLSIFMVAISINLYRGAELSCGCFNVQTVGEKLGWLTFLRNMLLIGMGLQILFFDQGNFSLGAFLAGKFKRDYKE
jgi:putative oxidoreductase